MEFTGAGSAIAVIPAELTEIPFLRGYDDAEVLAELAGKFTQHELDPGDVVVEQGTPADSIVLIARGKIERIGEGKYGDEAVVDVWADDDHFSYEALLEDDDFWGFTAKAVTTGTILTLSQRDFEEVVDRSEALRAHLEAFKELPGKPRDASGQAEIALAAGHEGEPTRTGPPTPDDFDEPFSRRRGSQYLLAHPKAILAFFRECTRAGVYPDNVAFQGSAVRAWRGIPLLPCGKIGVSKNLTSSVIVLRTGEDNQGVIGLHQTGIPDEYEPGLSVRFMGIDEKALISYLVTTCYSAAVLVPDALGVLEDCQVG